MLKQIQFFLIVSGIVLSSCLPPPNPDESLISHNSVSAAAEEAPLPAEEKGVRTYQFSISSPVMGYGRARTVDVLLQSLDQDRVFADTETDVEIHGVYSPEFNLPEVEGYKIIAREKDLEYGYRISYIREKYFDLWQANHANALERDKVRNTVRWADGRPSFLQGTVFETMVHSTNLENLGEMIELGVIQPRSKSGLDGKGVASSVYGELSAGYMIPYDLYQPAMDVRVGVIIEIPTRYLETRKDWFFTVDWHYGHYQTFGSAWFSETDKLTRLLREKSRPPFATLKELQKKYGRDLEKAVRQDKELAKELSRRLRNEVVFKDTINLSQTRFRVHFRTYDEANAFYRANSGAILLKWKLKLWLNTTQGVPSVLEFTPKPKTPDGE